jgi:CDP-diacylglycerol--serine O-phosphatidyltransferase
MAAGYYAISQAIQGTAGDPWHFDQAAKAIGFAIVLRFLRRRHRATDKYGERVWRELDSLADVIAFGVAPAVLALMWGFRMLPQMGDPDLRIRVMQLGAIASFMFLLAGASRLARFNIHQSAAFQSRPPGAKVLCRHADSGRCRFDCGGGPSGAGKSVTDLVAVGGVGVFLFAISFLMVSTWRFFSLKGINFRQPQNFRWLIAIGAVVR